jgi:4-hydroxythreonine-4-phosphate dehydrogenase
MGDPAGVGPELCLRVLRSKQVLRKCCPVVFGDASVLERVARVCRLPFSCRVVSIEDWLRGRVRSTSPSVVDCKAIEANRIRVGHVNAACGSASFRYIEAAVRSAVTGRIAGIATAPINKEALNLAGIRFPGHTEILAYLTRARRICMMMASDEIKVSLATIHTGIKDVPRRLSRRCVADAIELTAAMLEKLGMKSPRIAVCALNPHGGEHGLFGREEEKIIEPVIKAARRKSLRVEGPVVPDTAFLRAKRRKVDAYVVMYHDQGLIPFKMLAFDRGVNITLGLPIVRTSVDHGTAFDIAWKGKASAKSLIQSVLWAARLAQ